MRGGHAADSGGLPLSVVRPRASRFDAADAALVAAAVLAIARSALFVLRPYSQFDSDHAVFGLMAKHLAEGRAFPLFMYGQTYLLAVQSWMAAPLFALFGPSAVLLKLPLLIMNATVAWLLVRAFMREVGLSPFPAVLAATPFLLPSVAVSAEFVGTNGGNLEPSFYILLLWLTRRRPIWGGLILGIGFMQREFTIYGLFALLAIEAAQRTLVTRPGLVRRGAMLGVAAAVFAIVQALRPLSSGTGPGTSVGLLASNNVLELVARTCVSPSTAAAGIGQLFAVHWPELLGTARYPLAEFGIESTLWQGIAGTSWLPAATVMLAVAGIAARFARDRHAPPFAVFLVLVGALSAAGYVLGRCGAVNFHGMRYELLSPLGIAGLFAWLLSAQPPPLVVSLWRGALAAWLVVVAIPHSRLVAEYARQVPVPAKLQLVNVLESRGVRYGTADYWIAYYVTFASGERMIFASADVMRITTYEQIVSEHRREAVRLSRLPCANGTMLLPGVYECR